MAVFFHFWEGCLWRFSSPIGFAPLWGPFGPVSWRGLVDRGVNMPAGGPPVDPRGPPEDPQETKTPKNNRCNRRRASDTTDTILSRLNKV